MPPSIEELAGCKPTDGQSWARKTQQWELELKEAGWKAKAAHPNAPIWIAPDGTLYPGVFFAWCVMKGYQQP
jgi:hypothetical protein